MTPGNKKMIRNHPLCLCFILFTILSSGAFAGNLSEIYELSVANDPELAAAQARYLSRKEVVSLSRSQLLPQIGLRAQTSDNRRDFPLNSTSTTSYFNENGWSGFLTQPVFKLESWYQLQRSKNLRSEAQAKFSSEQQALIVRVAEIYFRILEREAALSASAAKREAVKRQLEQVQQRFDVGLVAITDVLESKAAFDSSTVSVIEDEGAQSNSFEPLVRLTGRSFEFVYGLSDQFPVKSPEPNNEDEWVAEALKNNYTVKAKEALVIAGERSLKAAKSKHLPTIDAQVSYSHNESGGTSFLGQEVDQQTATLNLSMPIFQGGAVRSGVRTAKYDLEAARKILDLTRRQVVENTRSLFRLVKTDVARVSAGKRGIESSESALEATLTGYEVGTRNIVDVLNAQRNLFLSQFQYASARYRYVLNTLRLKQTVGVLAPEDIYNLDEFLDTAQTINRTIKLTR